MFEIILCFFISIM